MHKNTKQTLVIAAMAAVLFASTVLSDINYTWSFFTSLLCIATGWFARGWWPKDEE